MVQAGRSARPCRRAREPDVSIASTTTVSPRTGNRRAEDEYPLSPLQEGMLFHSLVDRHSGTDIEQIVIDVSEPVDAAAWRTAWAEAAGRNELLRTAFEWRGAERPRHRVYREAAIELTEGDWTTHDAAGQDSAWREFLARDRSRGFNPGEPPLFRLAHFRLAGGRTRLVWTLHHILSDGRGFVLLLDEVFRRLAGASAAPATRPFRDYIEWLENQRDPNLAEPYWRRRLASIAAPTPVPPELRPPAAGQPRYGEILRRLSGRLSGRLREFAERERVTLNILFQGAWALLLSRHSGEQDVLYGAAKTTRGSSIEGAGEMTGLFLATLPMRAGVDPERAAGEWLRELRQAWIEVRPYEQTPLVRIKEWSALPASSKLFDTLVVFESQSLQKALEARDPAWSARTVEVLEQTNHELALLAYGDAEILFKLEYNACRFRRATAERLAGRLEIILAEMADDPHRRLASIGQLAGAERQRVLEEWNATRAPYPEAACVHELIAGQCRQTPDRIAVEDSQGSYTYHELNSRANQLARLLRARGLGLGHLAGVCLSPSVDLLTALLAVWKTGAAYVPLDPIYPKQRLSHMIGDSELQLVVTSSADQALLPECAAGKICIDTAWPELARLAGDDWAAGAGPGDLAYVIYTSGSTGKPKGVLIEHRSLVNFLHSMRRSPGIDEGDVLLAVTTSSFDIAALELYLPLLVGARVVIASRAEAADGRRLLAAMRRYGVTLMQATPVTWRLMLAAGWAATPDLKALCGGEPMPQELADAILKRAGSLWNMYGPTETTVWSTVERVRPGEPITVGKPINNTTTYIVGPDLLPVPPGVAGELLIGGDGLARGYHRRPDLTAERFIELRLDDGRCERVYRTGDLARYADDGRIECLGRSDHQVKIRGFRIELGEIEAALGEYQGVSQAVVAVKEPRAGDKRLVAYYTGGEVSPADARAHLRKSLPEYMIPFDYIRLDSFPLTPNGKVDRAGLAARDDRMQEPGAAYVAPRNDAERRICGIMEEVLRAQRVGIHDDFFQLGGNSLLAVNLFLGIEEAFGERFSLNQLFEASTAAEIAARLVLPVRTPAEGRHSVVAIRPNGSRPPLFWLPGGRAISALSFRETALLLGPDQPVYVFESRLPGRGEEYEPAPARAAAYIECLRRIQPRGPYRIAGFCLGGLLAYEMACQLKASGERVSFLGLVNSYFPGYGNAPGSRLRFKLARAAYLMRQDGPASLTLALLHRVGQKWMAGTRDPEAAIPQPAREEEDQLTADLLGTDVENLRALACYQPPRYDGPVTAFISSETEFNGLNRGYDPRLAWANTTQQFLFIEVAGTHTSILEQPHVKAFAAAFLHCLERLADTN